MRLTHHLSGAVAAALVAAAALVGLSSASAGAAYCSGSGVNVVVDFQGLGGGVQKSCDPDGAGEAASKVFPHAGFDLSYAQRQPGFVCRVQGKPSSDPCFNTSPSNAYWGLYWSDGTDGTWHYASTGVGGLQVPAGGFVAFSWQNGGDEDTPGAAPVNPQPSPTPTKAPTKQPTAQPTKAPSAQPSRRPSSKPAQTSTEPGRGASSSAPARPSASTSPSASVTATASASPGAVATTGSTDPSDPANAQAGDDPQLTRSTSGGTTGTKDADGVPGWVPGAGVVGLVGAAAGVAWWRRRSLSV